MPKKILLVDDEHVTLTSVSRFLREEGYVVEVARDGAQALKILDADTFDLLLSDLIMPEVDGYQVLERVRCKFATTSVILMSGAFPLGGSIPLALGPDAYLLKPFTLQQLLKTVTTVLNKSEPHPRFEKRLPLGQKTRRRKILHVINNSRR